MITGSNELTRLIERDLREWVREVTLNRMWNVRGCVYA